MSEYSQHFSIDELKCKCGCNRAEMDPDFLAKLEEWVPDTEFEVKEKNEWYMVCPKQG